MKCDQCGYHPQKRDAQHLVLTRVKTTVTLKLYMFDVTVADMNGLNRYLYVYNAPSIGMEEEVFHTWTDDDRILWWTFDTAPDECIELLLFNRESDKMGTVYVSG